MSFSFGFSGDDIDDAMDIDGVDISSNNENIKNTNTNEKTSSLKSVVELAPEYQPTLLSLNSLLKKSIGARMSYSETIVSPEDSNGSKEEISLHIPRRDIFDVQHQLMLQDNLSKTDEILMGLTNEDLRVAEYEGGLKSWECTFDVVEYLATSSNGKEEYSNAQNIIELGCGTGIPSLYILQKRLKDNREKIEKNETPIPLRLVLADYNESVLRLVSAPNLLFAWLETFDPQTRLEILTQTSENSSAIAEARLGEVEITESLISKFEKSLQENSITLQFISGGWSNQFIQLLNEKILKPNDISFDVVIASETVYSLDTLPIFTELLLEILNKNENAKGLVAAKQVYFGVGGGVLEFEAELNKQSIKSSHSTVFQTSGNGQGVARSIIEVSSNK